VAADASRRLAQTAQELRRPDEAEALYRRALAIGEKVLGAEPLSVAETLAWLGGFYREIGRTADSSAALERAVAILPKALPRGPLAHPVQVQNATILLLAGRPAEARPLVDAILSTGYRRATLLDLCRRHQILPTPPR
jgi:tetratricopeptide (TPR) repeat protein